MLPRVLFGKQLKDGALTKKKKKKYVIKTSNNTFHLLGNYI